jgi:peroxiredoxin
MKPWAEQHDALGKIVMLADGNADFSKALGIEIDLARAQMGLRCRRGVLHIEDGVVYPR